jgi:hypothetical protein
MLGFILQTNIAICKLFMKSRHSQFILWIKLNTIGILLYFIILVTIWVLKNKAENLHDLTVYAYSFIGLIPLLILSSIFNLLELCLIIFELSIQGKGLNRLVRWLIVIFSWVAIISFGHWIGVTGNILTLFFWS